MLNFGLDKVYSFFAAFAHTHGKLHSRENNLLTKQTMQRFYFALVVFVASYFSQVELVY